MLDKPLKQIGLSDLKELILDEVKEGTTIDYKRDMYCFDRINPQGRDKDIEEFLKDITSFANTIGGHLIIGIDEADLAPTDILGIPIDDLDGLKNQLHQLADKWIDPSIIFDVHEIRISNNPDKFVLLIRVPQSTISPHRVIYQGKYCPINQFYGRNSSGTFIMETMQLRQAFTLSETIFDRIKLFHREHVELIKEHRSPILTEGVSHLIMHLIPQESFSAYSLFDVEVIKTAMGAYSNSFSFGRYNMDGYVLCDCPNRETGKNRSYIQAYRNGVIEYVKCNIVRKPFKANDDTLFVLYPDCLESDAIAYIAKHYEYFMELGIHPPIWCFVTLSHVKGSCIWYRDSMVTVDVGNPIDRDVLDLPELRIDDYSAEPREILKPVINMMWNAGGWNKSPNISE
jgi:hypothetical protein